MIKRDKIGLYNSHKLHVKRYPNVIIHNSAPFPSIYKPKIRGPSNLFLLIVRTSIQNPPGCFEDFSKLKIIVRRLDGSLFKPREVRNRSKDDTLITAYQRGKDCAVCALLC
jgi:hypothetical protein